MLFEGKPFQDTNDRDIDVLVAMAKHGEREQGTNDWQHIVLLDVHGTLIIGKLPITPLVQMMGPEEVLSRAAEALVMAKKKVADGKAQFNPAMSKYAVGMGLMYNAVMVHDDTEHSEALREEARTLGTVQIDHVPANSIPVHHLLLRHLNGLFYSHWLPPVGEWDEEIPTVRVDTPQGGAAVFGILGEGLNQMVGALAEYTERNVEARV